VKSAIPEQDGNREGEFYQYKLLSLKDVKEEIIDELKGRIKKLSGL
jgi:hypothetical protein